MLCADVLFLASDMAKTISFNKFGACTVQYVDPSEYKQLVTFKSHQEVSIYLCLQGFAIQLFKISVPAQPEGSMLVAVAAWSHRAAFCASKSCAFTIQIA